MARVTAQQAKQVVKNALYRTIGETSTALRLRPDGQKTLSILMYHKVNDYADNPTTVPVRSSTSSSPASGSSATTSSTSTPCSTTTPSASRCPRRRC